MELAAARDCFDHRGARLDAEAAAAQLAASTGSEVSSSLLKPWLCLAFDVS